MERYYRQDRYLQHGHGLGSFLSGVVRSIIPWLSKAAPKVISVASKAARSKTGQTIMNTAKKEMKKAALKAAASQLKGQNGVKGAKRAVKEASAELGKTLDKVAENQNGVKRKGKVGGVSSFSPAKRQKLQKTKLGRGSLI